LDLGNKLLSRAVLDFGLMVYVFLFRSLQKCGIEDLVLYLRVHLQRLADSPRQVLLAGVRARGLELFEPLLDLPVIGLEQGYRVVRSGSAPAARARGGRAARPAGGL